MAERSADDATERARHFPGEHDRDPPYRRDVRRVYLDQNKWIDLARAAHGRPGGERFQEALEVLRYGTQQRLVSLPLSMAHYFETWKRGDPESRQRLGTTMCELSCFDTMAGPTTVTPYEIELACHELVGRPARRPVLQIFGKGCGHACGMPPVDFATPDTVPAEHRAAVRAAAIDFMEEAAIVTPPFQLPDLGIARPDDRHGETYAQGERRSAEALEAEGFSKDLVRCLVFASELLDIKAPLTAILNHHLIPFETIAHDEVSATSFLEAMPTRWMTAHLRRAAHENRSNKWDAHDLNDIAYLAIAAVHCDVVVTEKKWATYLASLPIDVPATVLTNLDQLSSVIV